MQQNNFGPSVSDDGVVIYNDNVTAWGFSFNADILRQRIKDRGMDKSEYVDEMISGLGESIIEIL